MFEDDFLKVSLEDCILKPLLIVRYVSIHLLYSLVMY